MNPPASDDLYDDSPPIGLLKGLSPAAGQMDVEVIVPYSGAEPPAVGEFLLAEAGSADALVGRVSKYVAAGHLVTQQGDAYLADLARTNDTPPSPIMRQMLRYSMRMSILGHLRREPSSQRQFRYLVGERAFATLGSRVRRPSVAAMAYLCNIGLDADPSAAVIGHLAYGQKVHPDVPVRFSIDRLKGRRTFVFARAGYGKSNLIKYLISQLYSRPPEVGLLIFDPEGEYALPDAEGRPALFNVPQIRDRLMLYTSRVVRPEFAAVKKGEPFVDFGEIPPQDIVTAFVAPEKQENVFANAIRTLDFASWKKLVALLLDKRHRASEAEIAQAIGFTPNRNNEVILQAIRNNLVPPVTRMHRREARLSQDLLADLGRGRIVVVDTSLLPTEDALALGGLLLHRVFAYNRRHFTEAAGSIVRCLAVIEEAQTVLGDRRLDDSDIFVRWVKEGRKYGLGCILVTQQPGAISDQIISQGDNFFVMHLLNDNDLRMLNRHNAHFSEDVLGFIRNEPIRGNCFFWSAPDQPFVMPIRVEDFASATDLAPGPPARVPPAAKVPPEELIRQWIVDAINADPRVWVYPLDAPEGEKWMVVSHDYLAHAVAERCRAAHDRIDTEDFEAWMESELPDLFRSCLKGLQGHQRYAVLVGSRRAVWVLPAVLFRGGQAKAMQTQRVAVSRSV